MKISLPTCLSSYLLAAFLLGILAPIVQPLAAMGNLRWIALVALCGYCVLVLRPRRRSAERVQHRLNTLMVLYLTVCVTSAAFGNSPKLSFAKLTPFACLFTAMLFFARNRLGPSEAREWVRVTIAILVVSAPLVALWPSADISAYDSLVLFRGAAGDANSMGHISALGLLCLIFVWHRLPIGSLLRWTALCCVAGLGGILLATKARSSVVSVVVGILIALRYLPRLRTTAVTTVIIGTAVLMSSGHFEHSIRNFIIKYEEPDESMWLIPQTAESSLFARMLSTRAPQWERAWAAAWKRPMLGWGFGNSATSPVNWQFSLRAVGTAEETNNDLLAVFEANGLIGLIAHMAVILTILRAYRPPKGCTNHEWIVVYCLAIALWTNFMLDGASHSVGYLTGGLFWILLTLVACPALHQLGSRVEVHGFDASTRPYSS